MDPRRLVVPALTAAVVGISAGGVLAVLADAADPVVVAFWRTGLCAAILAPTLLGARVGRRDLGWIALAGVALAAHFWVWFASLHHISVMRSVVLVTLAPIWVGLAEWALFKEAPSRRFWLGILVALGGVAWMSKDSFGGASLTGDVLALVGGMMSSAYFLVGRRVRQRVAFGPYGALVCGFAAAVLLVVALARGLPLMGWEPAVWGALVGLALLPQLVGHVGFNFAVKYVATSVIAALLLLEPVGATVLAWLVLDEVPTATELVGAAAILVGVGVATLRSAGSSSPEP